MIAQLPSIDPYAAQLIRSGIEDRADDLALRISHELDARPVVARRSELVCGDGSQRNGSAQIEVEDRPKTVRLGD
jgi:hypothetical protein